MSDVRIERAHRYEWWTPNVSGPSGIVEVFAVGEDGDILCDLKVSEKARTDESAIITLTVSSLPAVIAALQSYQERIGAAENE